MTQRMGSKKLKPSINFNQIAKDHLSHKENSKSPALICLKTFAFNFFCFSPNHPFYYVIKLETILFLKASPEKS